MGGSLPPVHVYLRLQFFYTFKCFKKRRLCPILVSWSEKFPRNKNIFFVTGAAVSHSDPSGWIDHQLFDIFCFSAHKCQWGFEPWIAALHKRASELEGSAEITEPCSLHSCAKHVNSSVHCTSFPGFLLPLGSEFLRMHKTSHTVLQTTVNNESSHQACDLCLSSAVWARRQDFCSAERSGRPTPCLSRNAGERHPSHRLTSNFQKEEKPSSFLCGGAPWRRNKNLPSFCFVGSLSKPGMSKP